MSVIAAVNIPADEFALGDVLERSDDYRVRLERMVPLGDRFVPYLWTSDEQVDALESALEAATEVAGYGVVDTVEGEALVRVDWAGSVDGFVEALGEVDATILEATGDADRWRFQLRLPDHEGLTALYRRCTDRGISVTLERVHELEDPRGVRAASDLSEPQRETLRTALDEGYFDVPRETELVDLADDIGVSDSAVSQRLRRGLGTVLEETLLEGSVEERRGPDEE